MNITKVLVALCATLIASPALSQGLYRALNGGGYYGRGESEFVRERRESRPPGAARFNHEERCGIGGLAAGVLAASALGGNGLEILAGGVGTGAFISGRCAKKDREEFEASIGNPVVPCKYEYSEGTDGRGHNLAGYAMRCLGDGFERLPTNDIRNPGIATYNHEIYDEPLEAPMVDPVELLRSPEEQAAVLTVRRIAGAEELLRGLSEDERSTLIEQYVVRPEPIEPTNAVGDMTPEEEALVLANRDRLEAERLFRGLSDEEKQRFVERMTEEERAAQPTEGTPASRDPNNPNPPFLSPVRPE